MQRQAAGEDLIGVQPQVLGQPVNARGASAEVVYHKGAPVGGSIDFALYKNDPNKYVNFFKPEQYPGGLAVTVSAEGSILQQTLADPDNFGATKLQNAAAGALQARIKYDKLRLSLLGLVRSLSFIQFNVPGFPPFFDFPNNTTQAPEAFVGSKPVYREMEPELRLMVGDELFEQVAEYLDARVAATPAPVAHPATVPVTLTTKR